MQTSVRSAAGASAAPACSPAGPRSCRRCSRRIPTACGLSSVQKIRYGQEAIGNQHMASRACPLDMHHLKLAVISATSGRATSGTVVDTVCSTADAESRIDRPACSRPPCSVKPIAPEWGHHHPARPTRCLEQDASCPHSWHAPVLGEKLPQAWRPAATPSM